MDKECEELLEKILSIAKNAPSNLHKELYPDKLGQRVMMQVPEQRFVAIAKYEGMALVLKDLGADTKEIDAMVESEANKTLEGKYS